MTESYLSSRGYVIFKKSFPLEKIISIKEELTVKPREVPGYGSESQSFQTFLESENKLYLPKYWALQKFGVPKLNKIPEGEDIDLEFNGVLRDEQEIHVNNVLKACYNPLMQGLILNIACAGGKCLAKNTEIIMYDGTIKYVQDIKIGDFIMGDDSNPRYVISTCKGHEQMYKIKLENGDSFVVNESHILSLKYKGNQIIDISISEYLQLDPNEREKLFAYKVPIHFKEKHIDHDPYLIGSSFPKNIPMDYKINIKKVRLGVLAGFIDMRATYNEKKNIYIITENTLDRIKDIQFIARSLGFICNYKKFSKDKFKCIISGKGLNDIPVRNPNKKCYAMTIPEYNKLIFKFKVEKLKANEYYGFEIDGNRRFVIGDFTITHNTVCAINIICQLKKKTLIVVHKEFLLNQWIERINQFTSNAKIGRIQGKIIDIENKDIVIGMLQSLSMKEYDSKMFESLGTVIFDECHHLSAQTFSNVLKKFNTKYMIGLSATPTRKDGLTKIFINSIGPICYKTSTKKNKDEVHVKVLNFTSNNKQYLEQPVLWNKKPNISRMLNNICECQERIDFIVEEIKNIFKNEPNRRILLLSDRINHLKGINESLKKHNLHSSFYIGGMKEIQLKNSEESQIILASNSFAAEGLDIKGLDTLIIASPKSDVVQATGRILRDKIEDRKHIPLIIDIVDTEFQIFNNQFKKRLTYYNKKKYSIIENNFKEIKTEIELPKNQCLISD